ncbi:hypothetical protein NX059_006177 [Plenodomus lindquistii]|nr:hypothetical protein NX059_006177 [Plenodomus lindquistii]
MAPHFMGLPVEIRLMIYEYLRPSVKNTVVSQASIPNVKVILVTRHVSTAILATCRTVYMEANKLVQDMIKSHVLGSPPRIIKDKLGNFLVHTLLNDIGNEAQAFLTLPDGARFDLEDTRRRIGQIRYSTIDDLQMANVHRFIHQAVKICTKQGSINWEQPVELVEGVERDRVTTYPQMYFENLRNMRVYNLADSLPVEDVGRLDQDDELVLDEAVVPYRWCLRPDPIRLPAISVAEWVEGWLPS